MSSTSRSDAPRVGGEWVLAASFQLARRLRSPRSLRLSSDRAGHRRRRNARPFSEAVTVNC